MILIGYEALSLTVAMVIVSERQIVSDDKFHEMPPRARYFIISGGSRARNRCAPP